MSWPTSTKCAPGITPPGGWRSRPDGHGRPGLPAPGPATPGRALQLRDVSDQAAAGRGRPGPGDLSPGLQVLPPVPAGNPSPGLVVPNSEKYIFDVLPGPRARNGGRGGRRSGLGCPDVSRRPG